MNHFLRRSLSSFIYAGINLFGQKPANSVRILCYHRINGEGKDYLDVSCTNFKIQMEFLKQEGYQTVSLHDVVTHSVSVVQRPVVITFDDGYRDNYENAFPIMKSFGFTGTVFLVTDKIGKDDFLTLDQIQEMKRSGFEFGSHTSSHMELPNLSYEEKEREIVKSKSELEKKLGEPVNFFCYPKGLYDSDSLKLVQTAEYLAACSNRPGSNFIASRNGRFNPYLLKRTEIASHDSLSDFKKKLAGAYDWIHQALHALRGMP